MRYYVSYIFSVTFSAFGPLCVLFRSDRINRKSRLCSGGCRLLRGRPVLFEYMAAELILDQIIRRVILSIFTGLFWLGVTLLFLRLLRIKNPAIKYLFLTTALTKSLLALIREAPQVESFKGFMVISWQFTYYAKSLPKAPWDMSNAIWASFSQPTRLFSPIALAIIILCSIMFACWRLLTLAKFHRLLRQAPQLERGGHEEIFRTLEILVDKTKTPFPKIITISAKDTPFTVGIRQPIIVISPLLIERLTSAEMEAVLAHEVAHITRKDYILHWPIVIMRDLLFFNPLTHYFYSRLSFERERACDDIGSKMSQPLALAKSLIKIAELRQTDPSVKVVRTFAPLSFLPERSSQLALRVQRLIEPQPYGAISSAGRAVLAGLAIGFFLMEIHLTISLKGVALVLS